MDPGTEAGPPANAEGKRVSDETVTKLAPARRVPAASPSARARGAAKAPRAIRIFFSVMTVVAGALAALLILIRIIAQPGPNALVTVQAGVWVGFAAAVVVAGGGWRSARVESMPGVPAPPVREMPAPAP